MPPPLIWLGWPLFPLLRGLPEPIRTYWVAPLLRSRPLRDAFALLDASAGGVAAVRRCDLAVAHAARLRIGLSRGDWHIVRARLLHCECLVVLVSRRAALSEPAALVAWLLFPYLLLADVQNTVLAAWLCFSSDVLYPYYLRVPRLGGISALDDQAAAGVLMWVPGSVAFLLPLFWIGVGYLFDSQRVTKRSACDRVLDRLLPRSVAVPRHGAFDLLRRSTGRPLSALATRAAG